MAINPEFDYALGDIDSYIRELVEDARAIVTRAGSDAMDPADLEAFDALEAEINKAKAELKVRSAVAALDIADQVDEVRFEDKGVQFNTASTKSVWDLRSVEQLSDYHRAAELRGRALTAIENIPDHVPDVVRESATKLVEGDNDAQFSEDDSLTAYAGARSRYILRHGSPEYVREFNDYMANPLRGPSSLLRAMSEGSTASGGALLPYYLDPTIVLTNAGVISPIRQLATVKQITTNIWHGVSSAGVTAEWIGEATQVADASPTTAAPSITVAKADAYVQGSIEIISDAALSGEIAGLLAEAKGRLEGSAFVTGTGSSQPRGLVSALSGTGPTLAGSSGAAGAADLTAADIYALQQGLNPRWRQEGATFLASLPVINKIRQLNSGSAAYQSTFWADFGQGVPSSLIGYPIYEVSDMDTTIVSGSSDDVLLFGSLRNYFIIDRMGMEIAFNPMVQGANNRPTGEAGWVAFWRVGADVVTSNAFRLLRL